MLYTWKGLLGCTQSPVAFAEWDFTIFSFPCSPLSPRNIVPWGEADPPEEYQVQSRGLQWERELAEIAASSSKDKCHMQLPGKGATVLKS